MYHSFWLLLVTGLLIVIASFCLIFSFDSKKTKNSRRFLFLVAVIAFIVIAFLITIILNKPLG